MIYKIFLISILFYNCLAEILLCSYNSDFLKFNNNILRETISSNEILSYFSTEISNITITTDYTSNCQILNEYKLFSFNPKNYLVNNNTVNLFYNNYTSFSAHEFNIIGIIKSSSIINNKHPLYIDIIYDDEIIYTNTLTLTKDTISFYEQIYTSEGFHDFYVKIYSIGTWCICPTKGTGFENNIYFFTWTDTNINSLNLDSYVKIANNRYSVIV